MPTKYEQHKTPFDLKLCLVSFLTGALFVLTPFLYVTHLYLQHNQTEIRLRAQIKAERNTFAYGSPVMLPGLNVPDCAFAMSAQEFYDGSVDRKATCNHHTTIPTGTGTITSIPDKLHDFDESKP